MANWTSAERARYDRHFRLPDFGEAGQTRLRAARVLVVGAGGLGSPVLQYLAAAGVGTIDIVDGDTVDRSNLQRQTIYTDAQTGASKAARAAAFVRALNPGVAVHSYAERLSRHNAAALMAPADLVIDGSDNFATRYLVNDACLLYGKPFVHGAVHRWEGQCAVFNVPLPNGARSPHYRDLFAQPPAPGVVDDCATAGVLGVLPGIIGCLMAQEALKYLAGLGGVQHSQLFLYDARSLALRRLKIRSQQQAPPERLLDYAAYCGTPAVPRLGAEAAGARTGVHWLDVRSAEEHAAGSIGPLRVTYTELPDRHAELPRGATVVAYCRSGSRSDRVVAWLRQHRPDLDSYSLTGGYAAYRAL